MIPLGIAAGVVAVTLALGTLGALAGGELGESLGASAGGLGGFPVLALFGNAVLGIVLGSGSVRGSVAGWPRVLGVFGPAVVALAFLGLAHRLDPCVQGWWDLGTRWEGASVCQPSEGELNITTRLHLLSHALTTAPVVLAYGVAFMLIARPRSPIPRAPR